MDPGNDRVLVTGAAGFIGSHLVEALVRRGCRVRAFVRYNSLNGWGWLDGLPEETLRGVEVFPGDIRDYHGVRESMVGCREVFHLAALIAIPYSYQSPESYVETNIKGTLNVLQAVRHSDVERVVVTSTSEVYGTAQYVPIDERHPLQGQSPYSATKIAADKLAESFHRSFGTPVTIVRPFNTYGPRQSARAVIPTIIAQLLRGSAELRLGSISPVRDLNYVDDTVEGFMAVGESACCIGEEVNIATGEGISIEEIARTLVRELNPHATIVVDEERLRPRESEVQRLVGDSSKARAMTEWRPRVDLVDGLRRTVEWMRRPENLSRYRSGIYNV
jgi:NAD dependent epimerase/dehydratase